MQVVGLAIKMGCKWFVNMVLVINCDLWVKAYVPKLNITLMWTLIFERYAVKCGSRNEHQKDMCLSKIGLYVQNTLTILGSIVNKIRGTFKTT